MPTHSNCELPSVSVGNGSCYAFTETNTREQFFFFEKRTLLAVEDGPGRALGAAAGASFTSRRSLRSALSLLGGFSAIFTAMAFC